MVLFLFLLSLTAAAKECEFYHNVADARARQNCIAANGGVEYPFCKEFLLPKCSSGDCACFPNGVVGATITRNQQTGGWDVSYSQTELAAEKAKREAFLAAARAQHDALSSLTAEDISKLKNLR